MVGLLFCLCINVIYDVYFIPFQPFLKVLFLIFQNFFCFPSRTHGRCQKKSNNPVNPLKTSNKNGEQNATGRGQVHHAAQQKCPAMVDTHHPIAQNQGVDKHRYRRSNPEYDIQ